MGEKDNATRSDTDYAIEFGRYLATAAEHYMRAVNDFTLSGRPDSVEAMTDMWRGLQSAIYEFRKRADRAEATTKLVRRLAAQQRSGQSA